ncbi:MAG: hypothetical protein AAFX99_34125 [Myxococcota bacterium]
MDKLDVILKAERLGGKERRESLEKVMIEAREMGCDFRIGGGRAGGINIRYGMIGYAILDVTTTGEVKLYASPHPGKDAPDELSDAINDQVDRLDGLEPKSFPMGSYSYLKDKIEDVPDEALTHYLQTMVEQIREVYEPYIEA